MCSYLAYGLQIGSIEHTLSKAKRWEASQKADFQNRFGGHSGLACRRGEEKRPAKGGFDSCDSIATHHPMYPSNSPLAGAMAAALIVNAARKTIRTARSDFSNIGTLPRLRSQSELTGNRGRCRSAAPARPTWLPSQVERLNRWAFEPSKAQIAMTPANPELWSGPKKVNLGVSP